MAAALVGCGSNNDSQTGQPSGLMGVAGAAAEGAISCGGVSCVPFNGPGLQLPVQACCVDPFTKTCGVVLGTSCRKQPEPSPVCASVDFRDFGLIVFGCCVDHKCGLVNEFEGGGCRDIESLQAEAMMTGDYSFMLPPAMACE